MSTGIIDMLKIIFPIVFFMGNLYLKSCPSWQFSKNYNFRPGKSMSKITFYTNLYCWKP